MPLIRVTAQEGTFDQATQNKFIAEVTEAVLTVEGVDPKDPSAQSLAWAYYTEQQKGGVYIGKQNRYPAGPDTGNHACRRIEPDGKQRTGDKY